LAAFWQQIAPIVPFLPTLPTDKYCAVCYLQIAAHLDTEEVAGSNPVVPTISTLKSSASDDDLFFLLQFQVLKGAEGFPTQKAFERKRLGAPPFLGNRMLINSKRPELPSGLTSALRSTMYSWAMIKKRELNEQVVGGGRCRRSDG
jgi:hypothetical protein